MKMKGASLHPFGYRSVELNYTLSFSGFTSVTNPGNGGWY